LQVDGEELTAGRRSPCGQGPRRQDAVANSPPASRTDCPRPGRAGRIIRTGVPASVETVARSLTAPPAAGTWHRRLRGRAVASQEVPGPSSRVNRPFGSFGSGLTRLAVPRSGNTGRRERARSTRQSTAKGQARSVMAGAGLVRDADGSWRWATALLTGTSSGRTPNTDPSAVSPSPLPVPAGPSCVSAGTSGEDLR
jgi:hypothetical protein